LDVANIDRGPKRGVWVEMLGNLKMMVVMG
jgi:hypothetical protein